MLQNNFTEKISLRRSHSILQILPQYGQGMPKISLDMPNQLLADLKQHVGDDKKFISMADAIRSACRKLLDQLDTIDLTHGRIGGEDDGRSN